MPKKNIQIHTQSQVKRLSVADLQGKSNRFIHVANIRYLYVRLQKTKDGITTSYVCRFTQEKRSTYKVLGLTNKISLKEATIECYKLFCNFQHKNKIVFNEQATTIEITGGVLNLRLNSSKIHVTAKELSDKLPLVDSNISQQNEDSDSHESNSFFNHSHKKISISELLSEYFQARNIKDNTIKAYKTAISRLCGIEVDSNKLISEITPDTINTNFSKTTLIQYLIIIKSIFRYANSRGYLPSNPFVNINNMFVAPIVKHRAALDCENFDTETDAENVVGKFLLAVYKASTLCPKKNFFELWILHMVLATRISETVRVIKNYLELTIIERDEKKFVIIETKTTKKGQEANFRIPLTPKLKILLKKVAENVGSYSFEYIKKLISASIPKEYRNQIKVHGSRAIYRTIIDLIASDKIEERAKEFYINHNILSKVAQAYSRNDLIVQRMEIQSEYIAWIEKIIQKYCHITDCFLDSRIL